MIRWEGKRLTTVRRREPQTKAGDKATNMTPAVLVILLTYDCLPHQLLHTAAKTVQKQQHMGHKLDSLLTQELGMWT
jgi:hypothetical protein